MDKELLKQKAKDIIQLLKDTKLFDTKKEDANGKMVQVGEKGKWWIKVAQGGETFTFVDHTLIDNYIGIVFFTKEGGTDEKHFNPPDELNLIHDSNFPKNQGFWIKRPAEEFEGETHERNPTEYDFTSVASTNDLRSWDARKIAKFLLSESESYDALYACILSQLESVPGDRAKHIAEQLRNLMKSTSGARTSPVKTQSPKLKVVETERPRSPVKTDTPIPINIRGSTPSPKSPSPNSKVAALEKKMEELELKMNNAKSDTAKKGFKKLYDKASLEYEAALETLGFGRISRKSNRRPMRTKGKIINRRSSKRRSSKKKRLGALRRTSRGRRKYFEDLKSLKKTRLRRVSRRKVGRKASGRRKASRGSRGRKVSRVGKKGSKRFGSTIYGLQGGLDSGPVFSGVYPISLNVKGSLPNLDNVQRTFSLNGY